MIQTVAVWKVRDHWHTLYQDEKNSSDSGEIMMATWQSTVGVGWCAGGGEEKETTNRHNAKTAVQFLRQGEATADIKMLKGGLQYAG